MNRFVLGVVATLAAGAITAATVVYAGVLDVSAANPHSGLVYSLLTTVRERSIAARAHDISPPQDVTDPERIRRGAGNYAAMCADCHLTPVFDNSEIRRGLYPTPPDLARGESYSDSHHPEARQFWIIKHGIKASGMPAWSKGGMDDESIWDLVAFINNLPSLSSEQYDQLVASSDGHSHAGIAGHGGGDHHDGEPKHGTKQDDADLSFGGMSLPDDAADDHGHGGKDHAH